MQRQQAKMMNINKVRPIGKRLVGREGDTGLFIEAALDSDADIIIPKIKSLYHPSEYNEAWDDERCILAVLLSLMRNLFAKLFERKRESSEV